MLLSRCKCIFLCKCFLLRCKLRVSRYMMQMLSSNMQNLYSRFLMQMLFFKDVNGEFLFYGANALFKYANVNFYSMMQMLSISRCKCEFLFHDANAFYRDAKCEFLFYDANAFQKCICRYFVMMQMLANVTLIKFFSNQGSLMPLNQDFKQLNLFFHGSSFILIRLQCQLYLHCLRNK